MKPSANALQEASCGDKSILRFIDERLHRFFRYFSSGKVHGHQYCLQIEILHSKDLPVQAVAMKSMHLVIADSGGQNCRT